MKPMKSIMHLQNIKIHDNYETPPILFDQACLKFKIRPTIDVCANEKNSRCAKFITEIEDSLTFEWYETFFMNPPYSKIEKFMRKAYYQSKKHKIEGLILTYSKTDTKWWHSFVENQAEVHFIKGRIKFFKKGIQTQNSAPYPSCWIIYRLEKTPQINRNDMNFLQ